MGKRKPMDKVQARQLRNQLLASAAAARLPLTEGVRDMRAISGMTQEDFARHRGVSARVIKAIELGQGNPTVATLNRIGAFFGLEVAFVPVRQIGADDTAMQAETMAGETANGTLGPTPSSILQDIKRVQDELNTRAHEIGVQMHSFAETAKLIEESIRAAMPHKSEEK